ncbi:Jerky protein, partial [Stegodyphus mimosarum]
MSKRVSHSGAAKVSTKRKHVSMSIKQKVKLQKMDKCISVSKLSEDNDIRKSTVYGEEKKKKEFFKKISCGFRHPTPNSRKLFIMLKMTIEKSDNSIGQTVLQRGYALTSPMLMAEAKIFHEEINLKTECTYLTGWLTKFKNHHGIRQL